jgi:DNA repair exonuclease SbcCD ATPase subunit
VEERLKEVFSADDTLQNMQVSLRKLEDALHAAEDKYQRVENKNHILEETNRSIERNFELLEETETALRKCRENIDHAEEELDVLRPSIEELAAASEKARAAGERLEFLDTGLKLVEDRIEKMQTAREWLARTEIRFEELNKEAGKELKLLEAVLKEDRKKSKAGDEDAISMNTRENVIRLKRQGWSSEEIAKSLQITRGAVELILDLGLKE